MSIPKNVPVITGNNISVQYGEHQVLNAVDFVIRSHERVGLIGRNGSGKSTLMRLLADCDAPDTGELTRRRDLTIGYLPQEFELDPQLSATANIRVGAAHILQLLDEYSAGPSDSKRADVLEKEIAVLDGWNLDVRIQILMDAFNVEEIDRPLSTWSGGEKRRVAVCRAIIANPDFLILDEPTNHLDIDSIEWLERYLADYGGTLVMVTHDRYFLDRICSRILELESGSVYAHAGSYTKFLTYSLHRKANEQRQEDRRQGFLKRELEWVRRGPKARTTKSKARLNRYDEAVSQTPFSPSAEIDLIIPEAEKLGNKIVNLLHVGMQLGDKELISGLSLNIQFGHRIGVYGRNGAGKTTLLRMIMRQLKPTSGTIEVGALTRFNYIEQGRSSLNFDNTVFEEVGDGRDYINLGGQRLSVWAYLKRFLFSDERIKTRVGELSGGERSRLQLAKNLKDGGNFLILDEPTNDLDLMSLRILEEALCSFRGCIIVVSHDRYFLNRVCTGLLAFDDTAEVRYFGGNYDYYRDHRGTKIGQSDDIVDESVSAIATAKTADRPRKLSWKEARDLETIEPRIAELEQETSGLESLFSQDNFYEQHSNEITELSERLEGLKKQATLLYGRWEELEAKERSFLNSKTT